MHQVRLRRRYRHELLPQLWSAHYPQRFRLHSLRRCSDASRSTGEQKSKLVAGLLGLFLGGYGAHNFYLGYTGKAVTQLVISVLGILLAFLFFGIPNFIIGVWALIESIMILCGNIKTDAKGVPLKD